MKLTLNQWIKLSLFMLFCLWLGIPTYNKWQADKLVDELCSKDGGIKVYETVTLSKEKFNQWGQPNFYRPNQGTNALGESYIFKSEDYFYHREMPIIVRYQHQVTRRLDGKLLGETVSYGRGGGDPIGPWEPSNYHCPPTNESSEIALFKKIFLPIK
jgi:hypothetical protein